MTLTLDAAITKQTINAQQLLNAVMAGSTAVITERQLINNLNYFPVADKDTGENFAFSLYEIHHIKLASQTLQDVIRQAAQSLFENARGNSGLIFSTWFTGLESFGLQGETCTLTEIKQLFTHAAEHLRKAMPNAMPGTMVSFIQSFTQKLQDAVLLKEIQHMLKFCLEKTQQENPTSRAHGVVDAGAMAFSVFLNHFFDGLYTDEKASFEPQANFQAEFTEHSEHPTEEPSFRYCTQAYLTLTNTDIPNAMQAVKSEISAFGDCDLLTHRGNQLHFHLHTNEPAALFSRLHEHGQVTKPKIEDMLRQYQAVNTKAPIALVTDSSAGLDPDYLEKHQIHVLPLPLSFDGQEGLDPYTIEKKSFYDKLAHYKTYPQTSSPNLKSIKALLTYLSKHYANTLVITLSSSMSSTYQSILSVAKEMKQVHVFDSLTNSAAQGLLVLKAAEMIEKKYALQDILNALKQYQAQLSIFVSLNRSSDILASGRVQGLKALCLKHLKPKLILTNNKQGAGRIASLLFFKKNAHHQLLKQIINRYKKKKFSRYCVLYASDEAAAEHFVHHLTQAIQLKPMYVGTVSPIIGLHAGPSALAIAFD